MARSPRHPLRLLVLGGTTEATLLLHGLADRPEVAPMLSLAGRTKAPVLPNVPNRIGGFGGVDGLVRHLRETGTDAVVDATHPFAARISVHAAAACAVCRLPLAVFTRPPWRREPEDRWTSVEDLDGAAGALGPAPLRVFLTTGRLGLAAFQAAPQHHYLIRSIDPPDVADLPPRHEVRLARPPFALANEAALMQQERIDVLVTKNSGGAASGQKIIAARGLGLDVVMVERPPRPGGPVLTDLPAVLDWIADQGAVP